MDNTITTILLVYTQIFFIACYYTLVKYLAKYPEHRDFRNKVDITWFMYLITFFVIAFGYSVFN